MGQVWWVCDIQEIKSIMLYVIAQLQLHTVGLTIQCSQTQSSNMDSWVQDHIWELVLMKYFGLDSGSPCMQGMVGVLGSHLPPSLVLHKDQRWESQSATSSG